MDEKLSPVHAMLQRAFTLPKEKESIEQPNSSRLTVPLWNTIRPSVCHPSVDGTNVATLSPRAPPTYALGPPRKYDFSRAQKLLQFELSRRCNKVAKSFRYDQQFALDLAHDLAQQLRRVLKLDHLYGQRYKIVVLASIVQVAPTRQLHQAVKFASRCLWNRDTDGTMTVQAKLGYDMMATVTAFAVYTD